MFIFKIIQIINIQKNQVKKSKKNVQILQKVQMKNSDMIVVQI
jgi:hypothetical protein